MNRFRRPAVLLPGLFAAAAMGLAAPAARAQSLSITYTIGAFSFTQSPTPGSSFSLNQRTQTLTLQPGTTDITNAQGVTFTANLRTAQSTSSGTASRALTINGVSGTVSQPFSITTDTSFDGDGNLIANDDLSLMPGSTTTFNLGSQGTVTFTPRAYGDFGEDAGAYSGNAPGRFVYTPSAAPEPSAPAALGIGIVALGTLALRARRRTSRAA